MEDFYKILGVSRDANESEIKKAYRKIAQKNHPDSNPGNKESEDVFKKASEAYEVLSDPQKRSNYDQFGSAGGPGGGFPGGGGGFNPEDLGGFGDIFESFFGGGFSGGGGGGRQRRSNRGADLEAQILITFEQSVTGMTKELHINKHEKCSNCEGRGAEKGTSKSKCSECSGTGQTAQIQRTPLGAIRIQQVCPKCSGEGEIFEHICKQCHGEGRLKQSSNLKVKVPAGIQNGATLRLTGKGEEGRQGSEAGDLYIHIQVKPSKEFTRQGDDIYATHSIHLLQAVLGDEVEVNSIYGKLTVKVPAGSQNGKILRIKNYGMPINQSETSKGNYYLTLNINIPEKLSNKEKELYGALVKESGIDIKPEEKTFFSNLWK